MKYLKLTLTVAMAAFLIAGTTALASTTFQEVTKDAGNTYYPWNEADNWNNGIPAAGDEAIIPTTKTATVDSAGDICGWVTIQGTGVVEVLASSKLTFDGNNTVRTSSIAASAWLYLRGSGSVLAIIDDSHTFNGSGSIDGQHDGAKITVTDGETLTNQVMISGNMTIEGDGNFTNQGKVLANNGGNKTLEIKVGGTILDSANTGAVSSTNYRWAVNTSGARLLFSESATGLLGHFYAGAGTLEVNKASAAISVCTEGELLILIARIIAALLDCFCAGGACCP